MLLAWADNFNSLFTDKLKVDDQFYWQFKLEEHKKNGTLHVNIRLFKENDTYQGPTKNGLMLQISSVDDLIKFQEKFNQLVQEAQKKL